MSPRIPFRSAPAGAALVIAVIATFGAASCTPAPPPAGPEPAPTAVATPDTPSTAALIDVGNGRSVSATCWGSGSPAVIYLHGLIQADDVDEWTSAPELRQRIPAHTTYCEYARVNTGDSSQVSGPFPVSDSVSDLSGLIEGLGLPTPVVLVGASFGGLVAYTYAGTHPEDVAGVVLLDPTLQAEDEIERELLPEEMWLPASAWEATREKIDILGAYPIARSALDGIPAVPGIIFVTETLESPDPATADEFRAGIRQMQVDLIDHFAPSEVITVNAPHVMLPVIPDQIAAEVLAIVDAAG